MVQSECSKSRNFVRRPAKPMPPLIPYTHKMWLDFSCFPRPNEMGVSAGKEKY